MPTPAAIASRRKSHFAFNAGNGAEALMYASADPTAVKPLNGAMQGSEGRAARWHPKKPLIAYNVAYPPDFEATKEWVIADVSGAEPSARRSFEGDGPEMVVG
jgi:hypothetical protein